MINDKHLHVGVYKGDSDKPLLHLCSSALSYRSEENLKICNLNIHSNTVNAWLNRLKATLDHKLQVIMCIVSIFSSGLDKRMDEEDELVVSLRIMIVWYHCILLMNG